MLCQSFNLVSPLDDAPEAKQDVGDSIQPHGAGKLGLLALRGFTIACIVLVGWQMFIH